MAKKKDDTKKTKTAAKTKTKAKAKSKAAPKTAEKKQKAAAQDKAPPPGIDATAQAANAPYTIHAQYVRDASFENPNALGALQPGQPMPEMDINIGMDARKVTDANVENLYEVVLNVKAEARRNQNTVFIVELQYGMVVSIGANVPQDNHHPLLLIEIPRMAFPFARQILSDMTTQGGYPPLLLAPVDFHALYMERFASEIEASKQASKN